LYTFSLSDFTIVLFGSVVVGAVRSFNIYPVGKFSLLENWRPKVQNLVSKFPIFVEFMGNLKLSHYLCW